MSTALKTRKLTKQFDGVRAIDGLSIEIESGKITGIVGPNGSGKTTLTNVLSGTLPLSDGAIVVGGVTVRSLPPYEAPMYGITRTFQNVRLFEQMTVLDNILVVLTERNVVGALIERHQALHQNEAEAALRRVGMWQKRDELAANLSYGQRKLIEIARALAMKANVYLFDEPYAGLFPEMVKVVSGILVELREQGKTVVLIEHNMDLIRELSDHVIVMDAGKLLAEGPADEVLARPEVVEAYLGA